MGQAVEYAWSSSGVGTVEKEYYYWAFIEASHFQNWDAWDYWDEYRITASDTLPATFEKFPNFSKVYQQSKHHRLEELEDFTN